MVKRRKARLPHSDAIREEELSLIRHINNAVDQSKDDGGAQLRKVACVRGLVNAKVRTRVWPLLLGVTSQSAEEDAMLYEATCTQEHRDSATVDCDMVRSLWEYTDGWTEKARAAKRMELHRVLTAAVCSCEGGAFYYQGLHDIAAVLLFVLGEHLAFRCLRRLLTAHLRDASRSDMSPVLDLLLLVKPLLRECDPDLHRIIAAHDYGPTYLVPWLIAWFSHDSHMDLGQLSRLFDLFLSSHPLMPLYTSVVIMQTMRKAIIAHGDEAHEVHHLLASLKVGQVTNTDLLARASLTLYHRLPPEKLLRVSRIRLYSAVSHRAYLEDGVWRVPQEPDKAPAGLRLPVVLHSVWRQVGGKGAALKLLPVLINVPSISVLTISAVVLLAMHTEVLTNWQWL